MEGNGHTFDLFICCVRSRSTARVILRRVVYRWRKAVHIALLPTEHRQVAITYLRSVSCHNVTISQHYISIVGEKYDRK